MLQKKICMLGAFAVGKTSLVAQCVRSIFSEQYHTTVGVKVDQKQLAVGATDVTLLLWDLAGEDEFHQIRPSYLRGAAGYLLVVDGTRKATLETALSIQQRVVDTLGDVPFIVLFNKADIADEWELDEQSVTELTDKSWGVIKTSAKTGLGVDEAFSRLAEHIVASS